MLDALVAGLVDVPSSVGSRFARWSTARWSTARRSVARPVSRSVSRAVAVMVPAVVSVAVPVAVPYRAPPSAAVGPSVAHMKPAVADADRESPAGIGVPVDPVSVRHGPGIVVRAVPRPVPVSRAVHHAAVIDVRAAVAGQIAHVDDVGRRFIDVHVLDVLDRAVGRDVLYLIGHRCRDLPRSLRSARDEPDGLIAAVVGAIDKQHRLARVDGVGNVVRAPLELRIAVVLDRDGRRLAVDLRRLWDRGLEHRLPGLLRAGHARAYVCDLRIRGYLGEALGNLIGSHVRPGASRHGIGRVPASRHEQVVLLRRDVHDDVALGVLNIEEVRSLDRYKLRLAIDLDELGRLRADQYLGSRLVSLVILRSRLLALLSLLFLLRYLFRDIRHLPRQLLRNYPVSSQIRSGVPVVSALQEVVPCPRVLEDVERAVRHVLETLVVQVGQYRIAVYHHENGGGGDHDQLRGVVAEATLLFRHTLQAVQPRQEAVHRHDHLPLRDLFLKISNECLNVLVRT